MSGQDLGGNTVGDPSATVESRLQGAADFMRAHGISGVFVMGDLSDDRWYEGISFWQASGGQEREIGEVLFSGGSLLAVDRSELERRHEQPGFVNEVVHPLQQAARVVYLEGLDLLDERFNVIPGFND